MPRKWQPREMRMLAEWLAERWPRTEYLTRVRLGRIEPRVDPSLLTPDEITPPVFIADGPMPWYCSQTGCY